MRTVGMRGAMEVEDALAHVAKYDGCGPSSPHLEAARGLAAEVQRLRAYEQAEKLDEPLSGDDSELVWLRQREHCWELVLHWLQETNAATVCAIRHALARWEEVHPRPRPAQAPKETNSRSHQEEREPPCAG
jgi:hypothetical protein